MADFDYSQIGQRIKNLRRSQGISQQEVADQLGKALRTVQKYETGEIEISIATVHELARILRSTPQYILCFESSSESLQNFSDFLDFLFQMERVKGLNFHIETDHPHQCSLRFDSAKEGTDITEDICFFLNEWDEVRKDVKAFRCSSNAYKLWKEEALAFYSRRKLELQEPEEIDWARRVQKRKEWMEEHTGNQD